MLVSFVVTVFQKIRSYKCCFVFKYSTIDLYLLLIQMET